MSSTRSLISKTGKVVGASRGAIVGPLLALLALPTTVYPKQPHEAMQGMFLMTAILLLSALTFAAECFGGKIPLLSNAATLVLDRAQNARKNWEQHTLRSFAETISWLWISMQLHDTYQDARLSAPLGALSGFGVVVLGDLLTSLVRGASLMATGALGDLHAIELLVLTIALGVGIAFRTSQHAPSLGYALVEPITAGACLVVICQLLLAWSPTHVVGRIVHDRIVNCGKNWHEFTLRSCLETSMWLAATYKLHEWDNKMMSDAYFIKVGIAGGLGGVAGLAICVVGQLTLSRIDGPAPRVLPRLTDDTKIFREEYGKTVIVDKVYHSKRKLETARSDITMAEVAKHNTRQDAWICVEGRAYDVTKYVEYHPGGWLPIANLAGKDVTDAFANYHPSSVYKTLLPSYYVGDIVDYNVSDFVKEHRALRQDLLRRGQFETRPTFYVGLGLWLSTLFFGALYMTICRSTWNEHMIGAFLMACFWQQIAFFGHDIGHNAIYHNRQYDLKTGIIIGNTTGGISLAWWKRSHNVHHVVCNSIENDPDNQHLPVFAVDKEYFGQFKSSYHQKFFSFDFAARTLVSYQHFLYYPVMAVARINLYIQGILLLASKEKIEHKALEIGTLFLFFGWFGTMLTYCLNSWQERVAYVALSHSVAGLLHVQITLSHFAEEVYHGQAYNDDTDEWFRMQVKTTLNIDCPTWMDWFHGGLQFQVEHHLWPRLPRHNLRKARDLTKALCKKHDIEYHECTFFQGQRRMLNKLYETALEARKTIKGDAGFYESQLWEGMNAIG
jgi:acyl-lipid Delta6-acetylenase / acyl-lipid (9-3)-desaturase